MKHKTRRFKRRRRRTRKLVIDPACWGKNKPLEQWWNDLSSFLSVVVVYKGSLPYEVVKLHSISSPEDFYNRMKQFDDDPRVIAILTAHPNINNAYETLVYPKAKDKTVDYVITHYDKIFKQVPIHMQKMFNTPLKKLRAPY
jgi:hypothetical protein